MDATGTTASGTVQQPDLIERGVEEAKRAPFDNIFQSTLIENVGSEVIRRIGQNEQPQWQLADSVGAIANRFVEAFLFPIEKFLEGVVSGGTPGGLDALYQLLCKSLMLTVPRDFDVSREKLDRYSIYSR